MYSSFQVNVFSSCIDGALRVPLPRPVQELPNLDTLLHSCYKVTYFFNNIRLMSKYVIVM